jgi:excisionase family DNA binding protein
LVKGKSEAKKLEVVDRNLTVAEAAEQLSVKEKTVRGWILLRKIRYVKIMGGAVRIPQSAVGEMIRTIPPLAKKKGPGSVTAEEIHARESA